MGEKSALKISAKAFGRTSAGIPAGENLGIMLTMSNLSLSVLEIVECRRSESGLHPWKTTR
jgi:hypothetical protein